MSSNLALKPGSEVNYGERRFTIMQVISFETVVARDVETPAILNGCRSQAYTRSCRRRSSRPIVGCASMKRVR